MFLFVGSVSAMSNSFMGDVNVEGMVTAEEINVTSNDSIYLGWMKMDNQGTHTYMSGDFIVHDEDEATTSLGVHAHGDSPQTHAELILEAGTHELNSVFNIVKNSPFNLWAANSSAIINDGTHGTFVPTNEHITWWEFDSLIKDDYGEILDLTGMNRWMMLNNSSLNLETVDLIVNGSATLYADSNDKILRLYENSGGEYINVEIDSDGDLNFYSDAGDVRLEIPDSNQQSNRAYRGIGVDGLYHRFGGDYDTAMQFGNDLINFYAGDSGFLQFRNWELDQDFAAFNYWNEDIDFRWDSNTIDDAMFFEGSSGRLGLGTTTPTQKLDVDGSVNVSGNITVEKIYLTNSGSNYMDYTAGDNWFRFSTGIEATDITASGDLNGDELTVSTADVTDYLETPIIYNTDGDTLTIQDKLDVTGAIDAPEISNTLGDLKIQPDVQGDVELFGDTDVANGENGKMLYIRRQATEGNDYLRFYVSSGRVAYIHANNKLTLQAQQPFTINSVTDSIYFKVGDNDSAEKVYFRDSDNNDLVTIDSNGKLSIDANMGGSLNVYRGSQNNINTVLDGSYTDIRFGGTKNGNRIGTWMNKSFQIVTDSTERITVDGISGNVGIGTTNPEYLLSLSSTAPGIKLENARTIMGTGYNVGGLFFNAGEGVHENVAEIRVDATENWIANESSPTRMDFYTTPVNDTHAFSRMIINEDGRVSIGSMNIVEQLLHVANSIKVEGAYFFNDGSTMESAQDGFLGHISTAVFRNDFSLTAQDPAPRDIHFKSDGTKVYISGLAGGGVGDGTIWEYDLSDPFNISSMVYNSNYFSVETWESNPMGLFIRSDGKKMYISGSGGDEVNEFNLGTAWDISSSTWNSLYDISGKETQPSGVEFRPDGKKMYIIGTSSDSVNEYNLSTEWDITTSTWNQAFGVDIDAPTGITFKRDGTRMYVMDGSAEDDIHEFVLSTPWDISTAVLQELFDVSNQNAVPQDVAFSTDMTKIYMLGSNSPASLFKYDLGIKSEGKIIGGGMPIYFTCGESNQLDDASEEWSCGGNGEEGQEVYLAEDVTLTNVAMDCNTNTGDANVSIRKNLVQTDCYLYHSNHQDSTTCNTDFDSGDWFQPYTITDSGHEECVITMRFMTR